jgi:class 3 adenylate cyclase/tetratricopeptide (TPR) repeat protein
MRYVFGDCEFDAARCELRCASKIVLVEPKVFKVLAYLIAHRDRVVHKDELLEHFWPGTFMSESALTHCLTKVRKAVRDDNVSQRIIKTVRGHGYRFVAAVTVHTSAPATAPEPASPLASTPPSVTAMPGAPPLPAPQPDVPGERKHVTVLVAGLKGVTALAQMLDAEVLYELLQRAATVMRQEVQRLEGYVTQCTGEHLIALFGAPVAQEDHVMRALHAALGIQRAFAALAEDLQRARAMRLDLGLGVHAGTVVMRPLGAEARADVIAPSLPIYLAERLQVVATGATICVSEAVWHQAVGFFHFEDRGLCPLPEITQPVRVYACTGVPQAASRLEAFLHRQRSLFLGRERAMEQLGTFWARACRGQGQVVVLFGEAGVGKSRLAYEFQRTLHEGRTLHAQTLSYGQSISYHAIIPLLRTLVELTDQDTPQQQRERIRACLVTAQPAVAADEPLLAHLLGIPLTPDQLPTFPPEEQKRRLQSVCLQVILQCVAKQPLCLLMEDLHWLDNSSQELLDLLVMSLPRQPVLLLGTARPGFRETWADRTYFHRLTVEPLSDAHIETFIHNSLQPYTASAALRAFIRDRAAGNPFFVEELLRTLQEREMLVLQDGVSGLPPHRQLDMPSSIQGVLAARIDRLPPEAKWGVGLLSLHQGDLLQAIAALKRSLEVCQAGDIGLLLPWVASALGYAYLLAGRLPEALPLLQQAVEQDATQAYYPLWLTHLSEAYLLAGRLDDAQQPAQRALALSRALKQRGHEVYALRLLAEIAVHGSPIEGERAEAYYCQALSLADTLGMRPLQAHCHFGLGILYGGIGRRGQAQAALCRAMALYQSLHMPFWLPRVEAALTRMT